MDITVNLDSIIERLLESRGSKILKQVDLSEDEIKWLCFKSKEIFLEQPVLIEVEAPVKICGT